MTPTQSRRLAQRWAWAFIGSVAVALPLWWVHFPLAFLAVGAAWSCARNWCYRSAWAAGYDAATREAA